MGQAAQIPRIRHVQNVAHVLMRLKDQVTDEERRHVSKKYGVVSYDTASIHGLGPATVEEIVNELIKLSCSSAPRARTTLSIDAEVRRARGIAEIVARVHQFPSACVVNGNNVATFSDATLIAMPASEISHIVRALEWTQRDLERQRADVI